MITRKQIFEQFTKADLVTIASHFDVRGLGVLNKGDIVANRYPDWKFWMLDGAAGFKRFQYIL